MLFYDANLSYGFEVNEKRLPPAPCHTIEELCAAPSFSREQDLLYAVLQLPKDQRTVIHLFYYEELSVREIAELLHLTQGAVKKRLSRAREALRNRLKEDSEYGT